ncbi:AsmA family protein [Desertibaculum subflavum]|uniref:AsmA family protein n=1 Tax=Desertibaculum subflavum TaxID=2268458 RepID=UPI0013C41917
MTGKWKAALTILIALLLIAAALALLLVRFGVIDVSGPVRAAVVDRLRAATGGEVSIQELTVAPSLVPTLLVRGLCVHSSAEPATEDRLTADLVQIELALWPLISDGRFEVESLQIAGARLLIEQGADGQTNWKSAGNGGSTAAPPVEWITTLAIDGATVLWRHADTGAEQVLTLTEAGWTASGAERRLDFAAEGHWGDLPFELRGRGGSLAALFGAAEQWPIWTEGRVGPSALTADGAVGIGGAPTELRLAITGDRLNELERLVDASLPALGPYRVEARIAADGFADVSVPDLALTVGEPDWAELRAEGRLAGLRSDAAIELSITARSESTQRLGQRLGVPLPPLGEARAEARLRGSIGSPSLMDISGTAGAAGGAAGEVLLQADRGRVENLLEWRGVSIPLSVEAAKVSEVGRLFGVALEPVGSGRAEARLVREDRPNAPLSLQDLELDVSAPNTNLRASGAITDLLGEPSYRLQIHASGSDLAAFGKRFERELPAIGPLEIKTGLQGSGTRALELAGIDLQIGRSRYRGELAVQLPADGQVEVDGSIAAEALHLPEIVAATGSSSGEDEDGLAWIDQLDKVNLDLALSAEEIVTQQARMGPASTKLILRDGKLALRDFDLRALGGSFGGQAALGSAAPPGAARVNLQVKASEIDVAKLLEAFGGPAIADLELDFEVAIDSTGRSLEGLARELDGQMTLAAEEGRIRDRQLNRLIQDVDVLGILPPFWRRTPAEAVRVNCIVGDFATTDGGNVRARAMMDTRRMTILGRGTVDLPSGGLDLTLDPEPKSRKFSATGVPVDIGGTWREPAVSLRGGETAGRLLRGVIGGLLVPLNQLAGLAGEEARDACGDALREARQRRQPTQ